MMQFYTSVTTYESFMLVRGYDEHGKRVEHEWIYKPTIYLPSDGTRKTGLTSISGQPLMPQSFKTMGAARKFLKDMESDSNFDFYGLTDHRLAWIAEQWPGAITYDAKLIRVLNFDIEVESSQGFPDPVHAAYPVLSITMRMNGGTVVYGYKDYTPKSPNVTYVKCKDEVSLLQNFLRALGKLDPDVLTGWNINTFDIPYLIHRITHLLGARYASLISPWRNIRAQTIADDYGRESVVYHVAGVSILDYIELYKKFRLKKQESYRLDYIAEVELGERKLDYSKYGSLSALYEQDFETYIDYNIHDVELVDRLDKKLLFIDLVTTLAYTAKINFVDTFYQTRIWDGLTNSFLMARGMVVPYRKLGIKMDQYVGAYVKPPQVGLHKHVVSFDLTSLYPSLMMQYNISPDTIINGVMGQISFEGLVAGTWQDYSERALAGNGCYFRKDKPGFMAEIVEGIFNTRAEAKRQMLEAERQYEATGDEKWKEIEAGWNTKQMVMKVVANSAYGTMGTPYFRFFDVRLAEAITMSGQLVITFIRDRINAWMNKLAGTTGVDFVLASDTDSIYLTLDLLVKDAPDPIEAMRKLADETIQAFLREQFADFAKRTNAYRNMMSMKREVIADVGFWTAKKRYALNVLFDESGRLSKPKIKVTGLESVRTTYPEWSRKSIKSVIESILTKNERDTQAFIKQIKEEFWSLPVEAISSPTGISNMEKYESGDLRVPYISGTPQHVKAALIHNAVIERKGLENKVQVIRNSDKIKLVALNTPNPIGEPIVAFQHELPKEFGLHAYVDREAMWDKCVLKPISTIFNAIGWSVTPRRTLSGALKAKMRE